MALLLNEEQLLLKDSVSTFLKERASVGDLRKLRDEGADAGFSSEVWEEMAEMGWPGIVIGEDHDGLDMGYVAAGVLFEEMGRNLSVSPLFSSAILAAAALQTGGSQRQKEELLAQIAAGEIIVAPAWQEGRFFNPATVATEAKTAGDGYVLNGTKTYVLDGHVADYFLVSANTDKGLTLFLAPKDASGIRVERIAMVDARNAAILTIEDLELNELSIVGEPGRGLDVINPAMDRGNACLGAELLGIAAASFERTVGYLKERKQFGTSIGSFQALQHRAAHLLCEIELCRSVVLKALQAIDEDLPEVSALASLAKAKCCEVAALATNESIQMHGGIGMTDEFDIGFFIKRARVAQQTLGGRDFHTDRFARLNNY